MNAGRHLPRHVLEAAVSQICPQAQKVHIPE